MKAFTIITLTLILSLLISILFVEGTYGNGEHMAILSLCLSCAAFALFGVIGSELHDRHPMTFTDVLSYLIILFCLVGFVAGFVLSIPMLIITSTATVVIASAIKNIYVEMLA
ncbi:TMhelix containing protein [Vibrio phage 3.058.O._10N.286.46.B8]|nr:TMhelix containing protein [Vibrio phage 2.058.O._10N.286.46.B8]AUS03207.1 TMhelix containing protein [Vibrio phage 3.058.O._10N.286.46.B8]